MDGDWSRMGKIRIRLKRFNSPSGKQVWQPLSNPIDVMESTRRVGGGRGR